MNRQRTSGFSGSNVIPPTMSRPTIGRTRRRALTVVGPLCLLVGVTVLLSTSAATAQEFGGEFVAVGSESCSQSWGENESSVQVALRLDGELASLQLDVAHRGRGGSDDDPTADTWQVRDPVQCIWTGNASIDDQGRWSLAFTSLTSTPPEAAACPYGTNDGIFEVTCAPELVADSTPLVLNGQNTSPSGTEPGTNELLRCSGSYLPAVMADAAHSETFDEAAPRSFYLAESATVTTSVRMLDGSIEDRIVSMPVLE